MMHMEEALRRPKENDGHQKIIEFVSEGSEEEVQQKVQDPVARTRSSWSTWEVESGGRLKEKRKRRRAKAMAAGRARAQPRTVARQVRQASAFWQRGTVTRDAGTGRGSAGLV